MLICRFVLLFGDPSRIGLHPLTLPKYIIFFSYTVRYLACVQSLMRVAHVHSLRRGLWAFLLCRPLTCAKMLHSTIKERQKPKKHNMTSFSKYFLWYRWAVLALKWFKGWKGEHKMTMWHFFFLILSPLQIKTNSLKLDTTGYFKTFSSHVCIDCNWIFFCEKSRHLQPCSWRPKQVF